MSTLSQQSAAAPEARAHTGAIPWVLLSYVGIGIVALLLRVLDLGVFLTGDEANFWLRRSYVFIAALQNGDFAATAISTHPGVTTMWLGSAGIFLLDTLSDHGLLQHYHTTVTLGIIRLPAALMHVVGVLVGYGLLRRLLPATVAVLAALLWATDPFMIAFSRVLHVDALAGTFATLSLLAACLYWHRTRHPGTLVLSGVCAGLAVMSKSPALLLLPVVSLLALAAAWQSPRSAGWLRQLLLPLLAWGAIFGVTMILLWPAVWANPLAVYEQLRVGVEVEGAQPHQLGNFYLGVANDSPGWTFYAVALAMRLTPWAMVGLLLLPFAWWRLRDVAPARRDLAAMALFVILFVVAMSFFPKKFNRYLIPTWPLVDILAAVGLVWGAQALGRLGQWLRNGSELLARRSAAVLLSGITLAAVVNAAWWHPYGITSFNQMLGGAQAGANTFKIGWGEGFDLVADWLNAQPDITGVGTVSRMVETVNPYLIEGAQASPPRGPNPLANAGYMVVYARSVQGTSPGPPFDAFYGKTEPIHIVRIHDVEYAWIYQLPPPVDQKVSATFGSAIRLHGIDVAAPGQPGEELSFQLVWDTQQLPPQDYWMFAHLIGPDGERYAQIDLPLTTTDWTPGRFVRTNLPLTPPADASAGAYRVTIGLYDPATGQRLPLAAERPADPAISGGDALLLTELELE